MLATGPGKQVGVRVVEVTAGQLVDSQGAEGWPDVVVDGASVLVYPERRGAVSSSQGPSSSDTLPGCPAVT